MEREALARVLYNEYWHPFAKLEPEDTPTIVWLRVADAALAALTPGPVSVHGFAVSTNTPAPTQGRVV